MRLAGPTTPESSDTTAAMARSGSPFRAMERMPSAAAGHRAGCATGPSDIPRWGESGIHTHFVVWTRQPGTRMVKTSVEPLPETEAALDEYMEVDDTDLRADLVDMARRVGMIVPSCVGLSLGVIEGSLTFTWVATSEEVAVIDAAQYVDDGPCVSVMHGDEHMSSEIKELLDEGRWTAFATASAAEGVRSTLSLPIQRDGRVVGSINLYAAAAHAFDGKHAELAQAIGATAEGAVTNADLEFRTLQFARSTPGRIADQRDVDVAVAILASLIRTDVATARTRLEDAAHRAGTTPVQAARVFTQLRGTGLL